MRSIADSQEDHCQSPIRNAGIKVLKHTGGSKVKTICSLLPESDGCCNWGCACCDATPQALPVRIQHVAERSGKLKRPESLSDIDTGLEGVQTLEFHRL